MFMVQSPVNKALDLTTATLYGRIQFLIEDPEMQPSLRPGLARRIMEDRLRDFDPEIDALAAAGGDPAGLLIAGLILGEWMPGKPVRYLRWDRGLQRGPGGSKVSVNPGYVPVLVSKTGAPR